MMPANPSWSEQKSSLTQAGLLHPIFAKLDSISFKAISPTDFDPLLLSLHAHRLSELLDRCMAIRKDVCELEVWAVKAETDYQLFKVTSDIDEQSETLRLQINSKTADQGGFDSAVKVFSGKATLEEGLSAIAAGRSGALAADLTASNSLKQNVADRWTAVRSYQDAYYARYHDDGNAHNFGQRASLLTQVFSVLIDEAFARAAALVEGVKIIYGFDITDMPTSVMLKDVDTLAMWSFRAIRSLSRVAEQETDTEVVIPLVQPWFPSGTPLVIGAAFDKAIATATSGQPITLPFNFLNNDLIAPSARLKGIGLAFGATFENESGVDHDQTADSFKRLMVKITPPDEGNAGSDLIVLGNVGLHDNMQLATVQGNAVQNLSPFGPWNIVLHPFIVWKDQAKKTVADTEPSSPIQDLKLTLRFYVPGKFVMIPAPPDPTPA